MGFDKLKVRHIERIADVLIGHAEEGSGGHTRLFDTLIPDCMVFLGASEVWYNQKGRGRYREHVVPCRLLRDTAAAMVMDAGGGPGTNGFTVLADDARQVVRTKVVAMLCKCLKIVYLTRKEAQELNKIPGLKTGMPGGDDWDWNTGDRLARLKCEGLEIEIVEYSRAKTIPHLRSTGRKDVIRDLRDVEPARLITINGAPFVSTKWVTASYGVQA